MNLPKLINSPVVAFLIPMRPKGEDENLWHMACKLLRQTVGSLLEQSNGSWIACVAGHERPGFMDGVTDSRIRFVSVDWEVPHPSGPGIDKSWKIAFAAMTLSPERPVFQMVLDADDLVHRDLVSEMAKFPESAGLIFERGWEFDTGLGRALPRNHLASLCGSTAALSTKAFPLPEGRGWEEWNKVPWIKTGHNEIKSLFASRKLDYVVPYKRLVVYLAGHSSSLSGRHLTGNWKRRLGFFLIGRPIDNDLANDFSYARDGLTSIPLKD